MGKKLGIDLGTTYSCVFYMDDTHTLRIIDPAEGGGYSTPSVVYIDPDTAEVVVGATARQEGALHPENMVERAKNFIGHPTYTFTINNQEYSPVAISTLILRKLIRDAEEALGDEEIDGAVITVPAYFGDAKRNATRMAGEAVTLKNGKPLRVLQILDEPIAAALAYGDHVRAEMDKTVMVYDLGGGTFDVTIMKMEFNGERRRMIPVTTIGNHQLGGKDWDERLADLVRRKYCEITKDDPDVIAADPQQRAWYSEFIERAKIQLSQKESCRLTPSYNGRQERVEVTREEFNQETADLLELTIELIDKMFADKGFTMDMIDEIILVGGSTRMPMVEARLNEKYGKPMVKFELDKAVAMGAALVADGLSVEGTFKGISHDEFDTTDPNADPSTPGTDPSGNGITDVSTEIDMICTKSYGLIATNAQTGEEFVANLILKDTRKPTEQIRRFGTSVANQTAVTLRVYENDNLGKDATIEESTELYESCTVELLPGLQQYAPLEICFRLDENGVLVIVATDVTNGTTREVTPVRIGDKTNQQGMEQAVNAVLL